MEEFKDRKRHWIRKYLKHLSVAVYVNILDMNRGVITSWKTIGDQSVLRR